MRQNLLVSAQNLERATENLNRFLEVLADQPAQLVFGEPLPRREMDPEFLRSCAAMGTSDESAGTAMAQSLSGATELKRRAVLMARRGGVAAGAGGA